ncbi:MAG: signal recognition particle subunit SRP19/SEC65 family protein [Candidatus Hodarchaeales archaeon]
MIKTAMYCVYPEYLMHELSRKEGRRLSREKSVKNLQTDELRLACQKLELEFDIDREKAYPRQWWNKRGVIYINPGDYGSKQQLIEALAKEITEFVRPALEKLAREKSLKKKTRKTPQAQQIRKRPTGSRRRRR